MQACYSLKSQVLVNISLPHCWGERRINGFASMTASSQYWSKKCTPDYQIISLIIVHHVFGMMFVFLNSAFVLCKMKRVYTLQNVRRLFVFSLVSCSFFLLSLSWMPVLPSLFVLESWSLTLPEACEAHSASDVAMGSNVTTWMSHLLLGGVTAAPCFHHLYTTVLADVHWYPKLVT